MNSSEKRRLLILSTSGLFLISFAQILGFYAEISDLTHGIMIGTGIGLMILSLVKNLNRPRYSKVRVRSKNR